MDRRSLMVEALDAWASQNVGSPAPSPALMSPKFRAHILETQGIEVTHVIVVPGHGERYALGADAARELAVRLLCPDALNSKRSLA